MRRADDEEMKGRSSHFEGQMMILLNIRVVPSYPTPVSNLPILTQSAQPTRATLYVYKLARPIPLIDER